MTRATFFALLFLLFNISPAQSQVKLKENISISKPKTVQVFVNYDSKIIVINDTQLSPAAQFAEFVEALGTYDRMVESELYFNFFYDELGVSLLVDKAARRVEEVCFQYLSRFGSLGTLTEFNGNIFINGKSLSTFRSTADLMTAFPYISFRKILEVFLTTRQDGFNIGISFTQDGTLELCLVRFF